MNAIITCISVCVLLNTPQAVARALPNPAPGRPSTYDSSEESVPRSPKIAGPRVLQIPTSIAQELHSLECTIVQGTPTPRVVWTKDGRDVHPPYKTKFNVTDGKAELEFPESTFERSVEGNYSCIAANFLGHDTKTFVISSRGSSSRE